MPRGIRNPKPAPIEPEAVALPVEWKEPADLPKAEQLARLQAKANDVDLPAHERLFAMQEIARIRANG